MRRINFCLSKLPQLSFLLLNAECILNTKSITVVQAGTGVVAVKIERSSPGYILEVEPSGLDDGLARNRG